MIETKDGIYKFESTGRFLEEAEGLSILRGNLRAGYDNYVDILNEEGKAWHETEEDEDFVLKPEEKKEIALYVIKQWSDWAGLKEDDKIKDTALWFASGYTSHRWEKIEARYDNWILKFNK